MHEGLSFCFTGFMVWRKEDSYDTDKNSSTLLYYYYVLSLFFFWGGRGLVVVGAIIDIHSP